MRFVLLQAIGTRTDYFSERETSLTADLYGDTL
jgi:hypothetical protein